MFNLRFLLPCLFGLYNSLMFIKFNMFNASLNTLTIVLYLINVLFIYILYKLGGTVDRWLRRY